ncbi:MAG: inositol monophosphatase family protein, partial [Leptolyngbyaceae bacterium]|nr:inositol monophosphatase family protein [Leptolyngbyaceae bacterium]
NIAAQPDKDLQPGNFFAAALTDADLSIQTLIEVALLGLFPTIRFYGEEYASSCNTKYFRAIDLGPPGDYLVTLDPVDGTKFYADGHDNYQIILAILNHDAFEAAIALSPAYNTYLYALRGEGTYRGTIGTPLEKCDRLTLPTAPDRIFLGWDMGYLAAQLSERYTILDIKQDYSTEVQVDNFLNILDGRFASAVIRRGKFIDGGAIAFMAQEAGCIVTTTDGQPLPPLHTCKDYAWPSLVISRSEAVHGDVLGAIAATV